MPINFIPNDLMAQQFFPLRQVNPRGDRDPGKADFTLYDSYPESLYELDTPAFLFWQCRESALWALEVWEQLDGDLSAWVNNQQHLKLIPNAGLDLNAYYDRNSLIFYEFKFNGHTTFSAASTDIVAHEFGHAALDAVRPDLWGSNFFEVAAFHEGFGDIMAILTALSDQHIRQRLVQEIGQPNSVERTAEDLADGVKQVVASLSPAEQLKYENATIPRSALNRFRWQLPETLPDKGPPGELIATEHSFGQVMSGCFYDTLINVFHTYPDRTEANLWAATQTVGELFLAAIKTAPEVPRFFRSVGRTMILVDEQVHNGRHHLLIRNAFNKHNISLGSSAMLAQIAGLKGQTAKFDRRTLSGVLTPSTLKDLRQKINVPPRKRLRFEVKNIANQKIGQVTNRREVALTSIDPQLDGVVTHANEVTLLGTSEQGTAILGDLPNAYVTMEETLTFVQGLLKRDAIAFGENRSIVPPVSQDNSLPQRPTHRIVRKGNKRVLERIRFSCRCCSKR